MAFDFSKLNFFNRLDARARVFAVVGVIVAIAVLLYFIVWFMSSGSTTVGPSSIDAGTSLKPNPGGITNAHYGKSLDESNAQRAEEAKRLGITNVPTMTNRGGANTGGLSPCTILCGDEAANVSDDLNDWLKQGKISLATSDLLKNLADKDVSIDEYQTALDKLVKDGKLTPEQARILLEKYKKQHLNRGLDASAKMMDALIKSGKLPIDVANELLAAQKRGATPSEYTAMLDDMVRTGKIDSASEQALLNDYTGRLAKERAMQGVAGLQKMLDTGGITPEVKKTLEDLINKNVPVSQYKTMLDQLVKEGKLTPDNAKKLLDQYTELKKGLGPISSMGALIASAQDNANAGLNSMLTPDIDASLGALVSKGRLGSDDASALSSLAKSGAAPGEFAAAVQKLVNAGKLSPEDAKALIADYNVGGLVGRGKIAAEDAQTLSDLMNNKASSTDFANAVQKLVNEGKLSADDAQKLISDYNQRSSAANHDIDSSLSDLVSNGRLGSADASTLSSLAKSNASPAEFASAVQRLVNAGKLSADDGQKLISDYNRSLAGQSSMLNPDIDASLGALVNKGKLGAADASTLSALAKSKATPEEFAAAVQRLVSAGKLNPDDAKALIADYNVGGLVGRGKIAPEDAKTLSDLMNSKASPAEFAAAVQRLVSAGKLSPDDANKLMNDYSLRSLVGKGKLSSPDAAVLSGLMSKNATPEEYAAAVQKLVAAGKLSPDDAKALIADYNVGGLVGRGKMAAEDAKTLSDLMSNKASPEEFAAAVRRLVNAGRLNPDDANKLIDDYNLHSLVGKGRLKPEDAAVLSGLMNNHAPKEEFAAAVQKLVAAGKLSSDDANKLIADYSKAKDLRDLATKLDQMKAAGASNADIAAVLSQAVAAGNITPQEAAALAKLAQKGKLSTDDSKKLADLMATNVSKDDFAAAARKLVADGKLNPEEGQKLIDNYNKVKDMRDLAAKMAQLKAANASPAEYEAALNAAVNAGTITSAQAAEMLRRAKLGQDTGIGDLVKAAEGNAASDLADLSSASLNDLVKQGKINPADAGYLQDMMNKDVPVQDYAATLSRLVREGKLSPDDATRLLADYRKLKAMRAMTGGMVKHAEDSTAARIAALTASSNLNNLTRQGRIKPEDAATLAALMNANVSKADYQAALGKMVADGKLSSDDAKQLMADYGKLKDLRDLSNTLDALQANNASFDDYKNALQQAVDAGVITPVEAARLLAEYEASKRPAPANIITTEDQTSPEFKQAAAQLNKYNANKGGEAQPLPKKPETFTVKQTEIKQQEDQDRQARLESIEGAMQGQASDLVNAWQAPQMLHMGTPPLNANADSSGTGGRGVGAGAGTGTNTVGKAGAIAVSKVIIKGGTILFAVLDTGVNSDYKDSPVLATIVDGQYKGAKLMGKVTVSQGPVGQLDRVMLTFTKMTTDGWPESKNINAFAIDPDTARSMLASNVNYHYMQRFGAMLAGSFVQGFGQATLSSGGSSTQSAFGTSTSTAPLNNAKKIAVAFGQMGDAIQKATQGYADRPPTVIVDSGVGLGILFMDDLS